MTLLRQGVIGYFDHNDEYREVFSGLRGCHGAKINPYTEEIYVTDSPTGIVWFIDFDTGKIKKRIQLDSKWLHDSECINENYFIAADGEHNRLLIFNANNGEVVSQYDCSNFGATVVFTRVSNVNEEWKNFFSKNQN